MKKYKKTAFEKAFGNSFEIEQYKNGFIAGFIIGGLLIITLSLI